MPPIVRAGLEDVRLGQRRVGSVLQVELEERQQDVFAVEGRSVRREIHTPKVPAVGVRPAAVHPRSDDEAVGETGVLALDRPVDAERSHQVLRVEPAADGEDRATDVLQVPPDRTRLPELVIGRVGEELLPGGIFGSELGRQVADRSGPEVELVAVLGAVVEGDRDLGWQRRPRLGLVDRYRVEGMREHERAAVIPIVIQEQVGNRRLRRSCPNGRMRVDHPRRREEPPVRDAEEAHAAVVVGHVSQEPLDRIPRVGLLIDIVRRWLLRPMRRHMGERALRHQSAADILARENVAGAQEGKLPPGMPAEVQKDWQKYTGAAPAQGTSIPGAGAAVPAGGPPRMGQSGQGGGSMPTSGPPAGYGGR